MYILWSRLPMISNHLILSNHLQQCFLEHQYHPLSSTQVCNTIIGSLFSTKRLQIFHPVLLQLMASNVVVVILVVIAFMAVLPGQLQIAVAIRPDPPSDSQITGRLRLPARSGAGFITEVLDHQYYTEDDSSARDLAINADWKLSAQRLMNKYPQPAATDAPQNPKFHGQHLSRAYPPPPSSNPVKSP